MDNVPGNSLCAVACSLGGQFPINSIVRLNLGWLYRGDGDSDRLNTATQNRDARTVLGV